MPGAFRHIISEKFRKLSQYTRAMGRFSDLVRYDLSENRMEHRTRNILLSNISTGDLD